MAFANGTLANGTDASNMNGVQPANGQNAPAANGQQHAHGHQGIRHRPNSAHRNGHSTKPNADKTNKDKTLCHTDSMSVMHDSMKRKEGKNKSRKHKTAQGKSAEKQNFSSKLASVERENDAGTDRVTKRKCSVCEAKVETDKDEERTVCRACIMPHDTKPAEKTVEKKHNTWTQYFQRVLPSWVFEPEYMVHAKTQRDRSMVHHHMDSLFSTSSGFTNYRGLLNLALLLLVLSNARLFLENLIKYGILINPFVWLEWFLEDPYNWPNLLLTMSISIFPLMAFWLECAMAKNLLSDRAGAILHGINVTALLIYPATVVYIQHPNPVFSVNCLTVATVYFLKLVSYAHVNYWCRYSLHSNTQNHPSRRRKTLSSSGDATHDTTETENNDSKKGTTNVKLYPANLNLQDLTYFMLAPTLCYELNFPRSARIRKRFLVKRLLELLFLFSLQLGLIQQWIVPTVNNSLKPLSDLDFFKCMERLLKLSVPNHFIWLIFFYCFFHSMLNVIAELLRFGDREFYRDWWNAENISEFWKNWNIPVHRWATRHVYKPLLIHGHAKIVASTLVFCVSAFFHEYLVSIPLRMFKIWAFTGMVMQVPLAIISIKYFHGKWGNIIMWLSLILGQPIAILAYVHDYYINSVISLVPNATASAL